MEYTKKLVYLSNQWYNEGLKKANIRDLSGAIIALKKSLQFNQKNIAARNLLGLVYYGRGEVSQALVEWIISKNIKAHGNIANYYMKKVQESEGELEVINQAVKKYNMCLTYCHQNCEDLAAIQLRKVVSAHPTFVKAHQLLALIYMHTEQYAKARQSIRRAHMLDSTDEITLRYMHELKQLQKEKVAQIRTEKEQTVSYTLGNETIIQPISTTLKDNATLMTILNIAIGIVVGATMVWFLAVPAVRKSMTAQTNRDIIAYSEQIVALENELDLLGRELDDYKQESDATAAEKELARKTQANYELLITAIKHYNEKNYSRSKVADELIAIDSAPFGEVAKASYDAMTKDIYPKQCADIYPGAKANYDVLNYTSARPKLEKILAMDETYENGQVLYMLMNIYIKQGEMNLAAQVYDRILNLYPDTTLAQNATEKMEAAKGQL